MLLTLSTVLNPDRPLSHSLSVSLHNPIHLHSSPSHHRLYLLRRSLGTFDSRHQCSRCEQRRCRSMTTTPFMVQISDKVDSGVGRRQIWVPVPLSRWWGGSSVMGFGGLVLVFSGLVLSLVIGFWWPELL